MCSEFLMIFNIQGEDMNSNIKKQYVLMDICKFFCALLIIISHYISENAVNRISKIIDYSSSLYVIVVPFFFACSGFLLFEKVIAQDGQDTIRIIKQYVFKILKMYLVWSAVYVSFKLLTWLRFGATRKDILEYVHTSIVYSTYNTLWFLPALIIGVLIVYFLLRKFSYSQVFIIGVIFYILGSLGCSYNFLLENMQILKKVYLIYNAMFITTRNGVFNGFPFIALGALVAFQNSTKNTTNTCNLRNICFCFLFGLSFVAEAFYIKIYFKAENVNTIIMLLPFTFFFLKSVIGISLPTKSVYQWMRKMSIVMFLSQRLFLSAIPELLPTSIFALLLSGNPYLGLFYVITVTMIVSEFIIWIAKKHPFFKCFC